MLAAPGAPTVRWWHGTRGRPSAPSDSQKGQRASNHADFHPFRGAAAWFGEGPHPPGQGGPGGHTGAANLQPLAVLFVSCILVLHRVDPSPGDLKKTLTAKPIRLLLAVRRVVN